ncbi:MAG: CARDB domain-containing protein [Candidatus Saliniplasma sp.]
MDDSEKQLSKILSLTVLFLLVSGVFAPVMSGQSKTDLQTDTEDNLNEKQPMSDDEWLIEDTVYVNSSRLVDSHITITGDGELIINDSTLTLTIDEYHPWEIQVWDGGRLELNNSTITTQPKEDLLRPFIKTNISAHTGSEILMRQNSRFQFPGWVYIDNSIFTMKESSFDRLPDDRIPYDTSMMIDDNDDCPRLTAVMDSKVLIEDSEINDYYRHSGLNDMEMEWRSFIDEVQEDEGDVYQIEPQDSLDIDTWFLNDPPFPVGDYRYVNPYDRISALYLEIRYGTEDNYTTSSPVEYNVNGEWKTAVEIESVEQFTDEHSDIWEIDLDEFYKGEYDNEEHFLKDLDVRISNEQPVSEEGNISVDKINLVSQYNNDINVRDSEMSVINSHIDADYEAADTDPREDESESTDSTTWMKDANLERSALRIINSSFRSYGVYPQDEWDPDGDPFLIADETSENKTWYTRWVDVTAVDSAGTPLPDTSITTSLDEKYKNVSEDMYDLVTEINQLQENPEAWEYLNETGAGYYDIENETYVTDKNGQVTLFLVSDRVNHPKDWPNTRSVGDYLIEGINQELGEANDDINLESFPNMNESATNHDFELVFDGEIPLPDFNVSNEDLSILRDGDEVSYATSGTTLELDLNVTNTGTKDFPAGEDVNITFYLDNLDTIINTTFISDGLAIHESKNVSVNFDTTGIEPGDYFITGYVDSENEYSELDTENNFAFKEVTISEKANLQPFELIGDPDYTVTEGEELYLQAGIENIGGTDANNVNVSFYYEDGQEYIGSDHVDIPGNFSSEYTDQILWDNPGPGEYNVTVVVDPEEEIDEIDKTNNELSETFTVLSESDLTAELVVDPNDPYNGDEVHLEGTIENTGEATSSDMSVYFFVDGEQIYSDYVLGLEGGEITTIEYQWTSEMVTDELSENRTITFRVEPEDDEIIEVDENIEIMKPAHILVSDEDISFSTELSQVGNTLEISAEVQNLGGAEAIVDVSFYDGNPGEDTLIATNSDLSVGPDSSESVSIEWIPETRGNRDINVVAEYDGGDGEDNHAMVVKPIFSQDYNNDLIVGGEGFPDEMEITGSYDRNGFVVVQEDGVLSITGSNPRAVFGLIMDRDYRYSIILRDQGQIDMNHGWLRSDHQFNILLEDDSNLMVRDDSRIPDNINLISEESSVVNIDETVFEASMDMTGHTFTAQESQFTSQDVVLNPSYVDITNSTFETDLVHFHDTTGSLTWVETGAIEATGDSEIELYRWVRATALSQTMLTIQGAEVTAENLDRDYSVTGVTDGQGITYLKVFTDLITEDEPAVYGNYRFTAEYVPEGTDDVYEIEPFTESLPHYTSQEYVIDYDMHFEDLAIPDLSISENDIYTDIDDISIGDEVRIYADVENVGETEADGVDVYFFNENTGEEIGVDTLESVSTEGFTTASVTWNAEMNETLPSEEINIGVEIDPEVEPLSDPNLDNNEAVIPLVVSSLPETAFDSDITLWRDGDELTDGEEITEYDDITINVTLANTGGTDLINGTVKIAVSGNEIVQENIDVESSKSLEFSYDWIVNVRGEQTIQIWYNTSEKDQDDIPISTSYIDRTINIDNMSLDFRDVSLLETEPGADKIVEGTLVRSDGTPIPDMDITAYLIDDDGEVAQQETATTGDDGEFLLYIPEPASAGTYSLSLEADYPDAEPIVTGEQMETGESAETGIPLWMIIAVIGAIAAGSVGGIFAYMKIQGPSEWVECGNCGTTIPADVKECPECGVEFETETVKCSECGEWIPYDSDECPECGSQFIKTGKEVQDYEETMKQQYENYVDKHRTKAKAEIGEEFTEEEFMDWWQEQPSYITFDEWLEREEARRKEGGVECPECGALNSVDAAICQKCGTTLITVDEEIEEEDIEVDLSDTDGMLGLDVDTEEGPGEHEEEFEEEFDEEQEEQEAQKKVVRKKVKKKPKKVVKKKVKKKPKKKEDE